MSLNTGTKFTKRLTTARLYFKRTGDTHEWDLGNVVSWKRADQHETVDHFKSENGVKTRDYTVARTLAFGYEVVLTEQNKNNVEAITRGTQSIAAYSQSSGTEATAQFVSVQPWRSYSLGAYDVTNVVVEVSSVVKTLGVDYTLDAKAGRITILNGGGIAGGSTVDVTFDKPSISGTSFQAGNQPQLEGTWTLVLSDQADITGVQTTCEIHTFTGSLHITDPGDNGDEFNQFTAMIACHTPPSIIVTTRS